MHNGHFWAAKDRHLIPPGVDWVHKSGMGEPEFFKPERFVKGDALTVSGEGNGPMIWSNHGENCCIKKTSKGKGGFWNQKAIQTFSNLVHSTSSIVPSEETRGGLKIYHFTRVNHSFEGLIFSREVFYTTFLLLQVGYHVEVSTNDNWRFIMQVAEPINMI